MKYDMFGDGYVSVRINNGHMACLFQNISKIDDLIGMKGMLMWELMIYYIRNKLSFAYIFLLPPLSIAGKLRRDLINKYYLCEFMICYVFKKYSIMKIL